MELINQHTKEIMEDCKKIARTAGLRFDDESLEYIVTNRDLVELSPKIMIPTLYDYWVHDVEVLQGQGRYKLYPSNPYETVINTRPAISFYNDNNPDWLNVMIFFHVLGHIDCFQNNVFFENTWDDDFCGQALADKRLLARLREEKSEDKRWVDYVIEFTRGIDNLVGYFAELNDPRKRQSVYTSKRVDYYFGDFLNKVAKSRIEKYLEEIDRYNQAIRKFGEKKGEDIFFAKVKNKYPEFASFFKKYEDEKGKTVNDLTQYLMENSEFLHKANNSWMKPVMQVVRNTSLYFQPQIRTKILNEGWASYWHQKLFIEDKRISGHEVDFSLVNAKVMNMPRVGLNPYGLGYNLLEYMYELAEKGKLSYAFQQTKNAEKRKSYNQNTGKGMDFLPYVRKNFNDSMLINFLSDDDWQDFVDKHQLFVAGRRLNWLRGTWEYYVKSRNGKDYRQMINDSLYHPPYITVDEEKGKDGELYLYHHFEDKTLITEWIHNTMLGTEFFWGAPVKLETTEFEAEEENFAQYVIRLLWGMSGDEEGPKIIQKRVVYTMKERKLTREEI